MEREFCRHRLELPRIEGQRRLVDLEVWASEPEFGRSPWVVLWIENDLQHHIRSDLTPTEARALAAILVAAAEQQERRAQPAKEAA